MDGERYYKLTNDISHDGQARSVRVGIECTEAGTMGNGLMPGTELDMVRANAAATSITVTRETAGGTEAEDLELYRERVRASGMASVTTGPKERYVAEARAVSAHIIDAGAVQTAPGEVTVLLLLDDDSLADEIVKKVLDALDDTSVRPLTDLVSVRLAEVKPYELHVAYLPDPMDSGSTRDALEAAVREYLTWQNMTIGRAFDPYRLIAALYQAGALRAYMTADNNFDGEFAEYTPVDAMTRLLGTVELEAIP